MKNGIFLPFMFFMEKIRIVLDTLRLNLDVSYMRILELVVIYPKCLRFRYSAAIKRFRFEVEKERGLILLPSQGGVLDLPSRILYVVFD